MRPTFILVIIATMALPLLAGCGATSSNAGHSMAQIMETIEKGDFTCELAERHPKKFAEVGSCQSNQHKYQKLIINRWNDPAARDQMYQHKIPTICSDLGMKDQVLWSTSDSWTLVAGGSTTEDVKALKEATKALGFESHAVPCQ